MKTQRNDYYVIDFVKQEYLRGKFLDIKVDVAQLKNINSDQVQIGKDYYAKVLNDLNSSLTRGDYVNALEQIQNYYQFDQPTLVLLLFSNLNSTATTAGEYKKLKSDYATLDANYGVLQGDFENLLNVNNIQQGNIADLEATLQKTRDNLLILALIGVVVMFTVGFLMGHRPRVALS